MEECINSSFGQNNGNAFFLFCFGVLFFFFLAGWLVFLLFSVPLLEHRNKGAISESPGCTFRSVLRTFSNSITEGLPVHTLEKQRANKHTNVQLPSLKTVINTLDKLRGKRWSQLHNIILCYSSYLQLYICRSLPSALSPSLRGTISLSSPHKTLGSLKIYSIPRPLHPQVLQSPLCRLFTQISHNL